MRIVVVDGALDETIPEFLRAARPRACVGETETVREESREDSVVLSAVMVPSVSTRRTISLEYARKRSRCVEVADIGDSTSSG